MVGCYSKLGNYHDRNQVPNTSVSTSTSAHIDTNPNDNETKSKLGPAMMDPPGEVGGVYGGKIATKQKVEIKLPEAKLSQAMSNSSDRRLLPKVRNASNRSQHQMSRMQSEIDMLSSQLDATQREKDMQRMEISRLRNQLVKLAGLSNMTSLEASNLPTLDDYFQQQVILYP